MAGMRAQNSPRSIESGTIRMVTALLFSWIFGIGVYKLNSLSKFYPIEMKIW